MGGDDKTKRGKADRSKVAGMQDYEVVYLAKKFKTTKAKVKEAIGEVGNKRDDVERWLAKEC